MARKRPTLAQVDKLELEREEALALARHHEHVAEAACWAAKTDVARHIQQIRNLENQIVTLMDFHAGRKKIAADEGEPNSNLALPAPVTEAEVKNPRLRWLRLKTPHPFKKP